MLIGRGYLTGSHISSACCRVSIKCLAQLHFSSLSPSTFKAFLLYCHVDGVVHW